jgi:predicted AAA+ superfamily ATPase
LLNKRISLKYWRDPVGLEIDWIIDINNFYIPVEVKLTDLPTKSDIKHLQIFLDEYSTQTNKGFIICQTPHIMKMTKNIYALPWNKIDDIFNDI